MNAGTISHLLLVTAALLGVAEAATQGGTNLQCTYYQDPLWTPKKAAVIQCSMAPTCGLDNHIDFAGDDIGALLRGSREEGICSGECLAESAGYPECRTILLRVTDQNLVRIHGWYDEYYTRICSLACAGVMGQCNC